MPFGKRNYRGRYGRDKKKVLDRAPSAYTNHRVQPSFKDLISVLTKYHRQSFYTTNYMHQIRSDATLQHNFLSTYNSEAARYNRHGFMEYNLYGDITFGTQLSAPTSGLIREERNDTIQILNQKLRMEVSARVSTSTVDPGEETPKWKLRIRLWLVRDTSRDYIIGHPSKLTLTQLRDMAFNEDRLYSDSHNDQYDFEHDNKIDYPANPMQGGRWSVVNQTDIVVSSTKRQFEFDFHLPARRQLFYSRETWESVLVNASANAAENPAPDQPIGESYHLLAIAEPLNVPVLGALDDSVSPPVEIPDPPMVTLGVKAVETTYLMDH